LIDLVVKLGGSLLAEGSLTPLLHTLGELAAEHRVVVVPGGGPFADTVRRACSVHDPGSSASHWMAILGMDQHAQLVAGLLPSARLATGPDEIGAAVADGRLTVLAPFGWLRATDPLPHGWHVTSDSIAAWVAARLTARRLVLLKSLDGARGPEGDLLAEIGAGAAAAAGIVDEYFERALAPDADCWVLSGRHPERLVELLRDGRTRGTRVHTRPR
jgi:5-(aminomethyl)-3-furanmethanol phosphate kinase